MKWITDGLSAALGKLAGSMGGTSGIAAGIGAVFALVNCFFGYRMMRFWIGIAGFAAGTWGGFAAADYFLDNMAVCAVIALAAGLLMTFLAFRIYLAGVFLLCGLFGFGLFWALGTLWFAEYETIVLIVSAVAGIGIGVAGVLLSRPVILLTTAISGGIMASQTIFGIFGVTNETAVLIAGVVLAILGAAWQFYNTRE